MSFIFRDQIALADGLFNVGKERFVDAVKVAAKLWRRNPPVDVVDWIEANLVIPYEMAADRAGPVKLSPLQAGIIRASQESGISRVVWRKPPRSGFSTLSSFVMSYYSVYEGDDTIFYERNEGDSQKFHDKFLYPIITNSPAISGYMRSDSRSGVQDKWHDRILTNGAALQIRSASTTGAFRQVKGKVVVMDEVSDPAYQSAKGHSEGSKVSLAAARAQQYFDAIMFLGSTPTDEDTCIVSQEIEKSDKRLFKMVFPCCGTYQHFEKHVGINNEGPDHRMPAPGLYYQVSEAGVVHDAWYQCAECASPVRETSKSEMINGPDAAWVATCLTPIDPSIAGFDDWAIYHSDPQVTWRHLCQEHYASLSDPEKRQPFKNLRLCLPWERVEQRPIPETALQQRAEPYQAPCPDGVVVIVGGMDSQEGSEKKPSRHEIVWVGYGANEESWVLGWDVLDEHEPFSVDAKAQLLTLLDREWKKPDGTKLQVAAIGVDIGWQMNSAVDLCRDPEFKRRGLVPMRGANDRSFTPAINKKLGTHKQTGTQYYRVGGQSVTETLLRRLKIANGPEGIHFPRALPIEFYKSLTAVKYERDKKTGKKYYADLPGNEVLDCMKYAYAVLQHIKQKHPKIRNALKLDTRMQQQSQSRSAYVGEDRSIAAVGGSVKPGNQIQNRGRITYDDLAAKRIETRQRESEKPSQVQSAQNEQSKPKVRRLGRVGVARW